MDTCPPTGFSPQISMHLLPFSLPRWDTLPEIVCQLNCKVLSGYGKEMCHAEAAHVMKTYHVNVVGENMAPLLPLHTHRLPCASFACEGLVGSQNFECKQPRPGSTYLFYGTSIYLRLNTMQSFIFDFTIFAPINLAPHKNRESYAISSIIKCLYLYTFGNGVPF